jgi:hypothetical protein
MNPLQETKWVNSVPPAILVDNATLGFTELDTLGYDYLTVALIMGATDIAVTAAGLTESDTAGSGHASITATVLGTATDAYGTTSVLPVATADNGIFLWEIDLRGRKRYIDATITIGDGTVGGYYTVISILSRAEGIKQTLTGRNLLGCMQL